MGTVIVPLALLFASSISSFVSSISPQWGWIGLGVWVMFQLYWPFWQTKLQQWHNDFTTRFERIEVTQLSLAEEINGVNEDRVRELHGYGTLQTEDLKRDSEDS